MTSTTEEAQALRLALHGPAINEMSAAGVVRMPERIRAGRSKRGRPGTLLASGAPQHARHRVQDGL